MNICSKAGGIIQISSNRRLWLSAIRRYHHWHPDFREEQIVIDTENKREILALEILQESEMLN